MNKYLFHILFTLSLLIILSRVEGQNIFVLEKPALKNYKFYQNDAIQLDVDGKKVSDRIVFISDSSLVLSNNGEVLLSDISKIYTGRWGFTFLQRLFLSLGIPYLVLSTLNGAISKEQAMPDGKTLAIGGGLIVAAFALSPLTQRKHKIYPLGNWKVKILDMTD